MKIEGTVRREDGGKLPDGAVVALVRGERSRAVIANAAIDDRGRFALTVPEGGPHRPQVGYGLRVMAGEIPLAVVSGPGGWRAGEEPKEPIVLVVAPAGPERIVEGSIRHADKTAIAGVTVRATRLSLAGEATLGEATSAADGGYAIRYRSQGGAVDLVVRAFAAGEQAALATSPVTYAAGAREQVDLTIGDRRFRGRSELAAIDRVLTAELDGVDLATLDAEDVAYLAEKHGLDPDRVARYLVARRIAAGTDVPVEAAYGLLRTGAPPSLARLLARPPADVERMLARAADANIVSLDTGARAAEVTAALRRARAAQLSSPAASRSLGAVLAAVGVGDDRAKDLLARRLAHDGEPAAFWTALRADPAWGHAAIDRAQLGLQLGRIALGHAPMVAALVGRGIAHARDVAALTRADWRALIDGAVDGREVGVPTGVRGDDDAARRDTYAGILARQAELAFPTAAVTAAMKRAAVPAEADLVAFLEQNPQFDLATSAVHPTLADPETNLAGIANTSALATQLAASQRVFKIAPATGKYTTMTTLIADGLDSALAVQQLRREQFVGAYQDSLGTDDATTVYGNAVAQSATALQVMVTHGAAFQTTQVASVQSVSNASAAAVASIPDYRTLFGSIDFCQCEACRSVLSPAAYFVDLLAWLDVIADGAVDLLLARRPDLGTMALSCDNTNVPLPYVDLVNEILENAVSRSETARGVAGFTVVDHDETTLTAPDLLASPEYENTAVYDQVLTAACHPFELPFDRGTTQARVYLRQLGVDRWSLMETFQRRSGTDDPRDHEIAGEYLALSPSEQALIVGTDGHPQWELWGYTAEDGLVDPRGGSGTVGWRRSLEYLPELLRRSGLEYAELLDLLHGDYVNPGGRLGISSTGTDYCDLTTMELKEAADDGSLHPPDAAAFGRIRRFVRLWRAAGVSMLELDKILHALNDATDIAARTLRQLADLRRIQGLVRIDLLPLLAWFGPIDLEPDREGLENPVLPLYQRVFLSHAIGGDAADWPFALDSTGTELAVTGQLASSATAQLQAALQIDATQLADAQARVAADLGTTADTLAIDLDTLGRLYRIVSLARALKLDVDDALAYRDLIAVDPFADPADARELIETVQASAATGFTIDELQYLLAHDADAAAAVGPTEDQLAVILAGIRAGIQQIDDESTTVTADPTGEQTRQGLSALVPTDDLDALMAVIAGTSTLAAADQVALATTYLAPFLDVTTLLATTGSEERYAYVIALLGPYLAQRAKEALVEDQIATAIGVEVAVAEDLLVERVTWGGVRGLDVFLADSFVGGVTATAGEEATSGVDADLDPVDQAAAFATLTLLDKIGRVLSRLAITADEEAWLFEHQRALGIADLAALPAVEGAPPVAFTDWQGLTDLIGARDRLPGSTPTFVELLDPLLAVDPADTAAAAAALAQVADDLATRTGWRAEDVTSVITTTLAIGSPRALAHGEPLGRLLDCMALVTRIGCSAAQLDAWRVPALATADGAAVTLAVKARYDVDAWPEVARPLRDQLRERARAALVAWLLHDQGLDDAADLFGEYLIDVEMSPCMLTSRLKQGISSVQLFIQRCFLNLEAGVSLTPDDDERWQWMRTYRVWEANRKVFLYPENWVEPELRDDRTPLFRELESALQQDEITDDKVETCYLQYLQGLAAIARLEIAGLYHQVDTDGDETTDILHVVGRTAGAPRTYYLRQREDGVWSAWEKIDLDIESEQVIPVVYERRLMLFWPIFVAQGTETTRFWSVQLAGSERWDGGWSAKRLSVDALKTDNQDDPSKYLFRTTIDDGLTISMIWAPAYGESGADGHHVGDFVPDPCTGSIRVVPELSGDDTREVVCPWYWAVDGMGFTILYFGDGDEQLYLTTGDVDEDGDLVDGTDDPSVVVLANLPTTPAVAYTAQYDDFCSQDTFFFYDDKRAFVVEPSTIGRIAPVDVAVDQIDVGSIGHYDRPDEYHVDTQPPSWQPSGIPFLADELATGATSETQLRRTQRVVGSYRAVDPGIYATETRYTFTPFFHPYVCDLVTALRADGVDGLLAPSETKEDDDGDDPLARQQKTHKYFVNTYQPTERVLEPYPVNELDFDAGGAYAQYNWELFFHAPLLIADRLRRNQRFEDALRWYQFIFDPMNQNASYEVPARYWKVKPFLEPVDGPIQSLLALLPQSSTDPDVIAVQESLRAQIDAWLDDPFDPHTVAALRPGAYQKSVVMKYLDNLIEWGDYLFRQDTIETINQATQLYVLALQILGDEPEVIPPRTEVATTSFASIRGQLDELSNALVDVENLLAAPASPVDSGDGTLLGSVTYFCVPANDKLSAYWATVEDRLYKIRHCMNIAGVVRSLALFEPPIDPGMLVRAAAAGIDLSSAIADLSAPLPVYRFSIVMAKAQAFCATVRGLGAALLAALEKRDAEELAQLRQGQEVALLDAGRDVKKLQVKEAEDQQAALEKTQAMVTARREYYDGLIEDDVNPQEQEQIDKLKGARDWSWAASITEAVGGVLYLFPNLSAGFPSGLTSEFGGLNLGGAADAAAAVLRAEANQKSTAAQLAAINAGYGRRAAEWEHQRDQADKELAQLDKQLAAAGERLAIARRELANHELQLAGAREVDAWMRSRYTSRDLYDWMVGQLSSLYFQSYQLAYDLAKRAEQCFRHELAQPDAAFVQFGHWDSLKKGLLAGEGLQYDLERCEAAYLDGDAREYEITRHVSLAALDPVALIELRDQGTCSFTLPEALFDLDFPGHYLRRIKSVAVTVPCVAGPYTGFHCTLTLTSSSVRHDPDAGAAYPRTGTDDARFRDELGVASIVTSVGQNDAGVFELSTQDPRYLPFERRGLVDSAWTLSLAPALAQLDPQTISDVVLHVRYTARDGGSALATQVRDTLAAQLATIADGGGLMRLTSAAREQPDAWYGFLHPIGTDPQVLDLDLGEDRFPYAFRGRGIELRKLELIGTLATVDGFDATSLVVDVASVAEDGTATPLVAGVSLASSAAVLGGQPWAELTPAGVLSPGTLRLTLATATTSAAYLSSTTVDGVAVQRLADGVLDDVLVVAHFGYAG